MAPERMNTFSSNQLRNSPNMMSSSVGPQLAGISNPSNPPPLPPRPHSMNYSGYNDYRPFGSSSFGSYGYGSNYYRGMGYGGYGSYSGYSPYFGSSAYNSYGPMGGPSGDVENRFMQYAEGSVRSTFQSLEAVLQTFSSITMMMESTYFAITNSFRALLSVADSIERLRSTLGQILSTFALFRLLRWLYRRILHTVGLRNEEINEESLWQRSLVANGSENTGESTSWSGFLLFGSLIVIPYIINKMVNNIRRIQMKGMDPKEWFACEEPVYAATALYDFTASSPEELSLKAGQKIWLAPSSLQPKNCSGWMKATDSTNVGLIPSNYITIVAQLKKRSESRIPETPLMTNIDATPKADPPANPSTTTTTMTTTPPTATTDTLQKSESDTNL